MATGDIGQTLVPPIAGTLAAVIIWQAGLGFVIPLLIIGGLGIWVVVPSHSQAESSSEALSMDTARYVLKELRRPSMMFVTFILVLFFFLAGVHVIFPDVLPTVIGVSIEELPETVDLVTKIFGRDFS